MGCGEAGEDENGWDASLHETLAGYLKLTLHRMRAGFRKALKRFEGRGQSRFNAYELFKGVRDAVKAIIPEIEYEGQEVILSYGGDNDPTCRLVYEPEDY